MKQTGTQKKHTWYCETQSEMRINIDNIDWKWIYNGFMELI